MNTITLSSKGQVVIPKFMRQSAHLSVGDELSISYVGGEIRLRPLAAHSSSALDLVAGCLARPGRKPKSDEEVKLAIKKRLKAKNSASVDRAQA
jgi:AbrB family looped-hinge helix DNA binding protein